MKSSKKSLQRRRRVKGTILSKKRIVQKIAILILKMMPMKRQRILLILTREREP
jgi:hypothetical protein